MKQWPKDNKPASFDDIADPLVAALADAFGNGMVRTEPVKRKNGYGFRSDLSKIGTIDYHGLDIGDDDKATCNTPAYRLWGESLQSEWRDQGRTPAEVIIGLAIQLGIEQGRRLERQNGTDGQTLKLMRVLLDSAK